MPDTDTDTELSINSPSTPTSSTSTRTTTTVDGSSKQPATPPATLRPVEATLADLADPHVAALRATGDGPIVRLLGDVEQLLGASVGDRYRVTAGGQWVCRVCGCLVDYIEGRDLHDAWHDSERPATVRAEAAEAECADLWDAVDKARSVLDDALATIRRREQVEARARAGLAIAEAVRER